MNTMIKRGLFAMILPVLFLGSTAQAWQELYRTQDNKKFVLTRRHGLRINGLNVYGAQNRRGNEEYHPKMGLSFYDKNADKNPDTRAWVSVRKLNRLADQWYRNGRSETVVMNTYFHKKPIVIDPALLLALATW